MCEEFGNVNISEKSSGSPYACNKSDHDCSSEFIVKKSDLSIGP